MLGMKGMLCYLWWTGDKDAGHERNVALFVMNRWDKMLEWKECCAVCGEQVTRMLPGGLNVIGIFAVAPGEMLKDSQSKLRQVCDDAKHMQLQ